MKQRQQNTNNETLVKFNQDIISLIKNAKKIGLDKEQTIILVKQCFIEEEFPELPDEVEFRNEAEKFIEKEYENLFNASLRYEQEYATYRSLRNLNYRLNEEELKRFLLEVICSIYKVFKMETFDKKEVKKLNVERTKFLFPEMRTNHKSYFKIAYQTLIRYAYEKKYLNDNALVFVNKYETKTYEEKGVVKLISMVVLEM